MSNSQSLKRIFSSSDSSKYPTLGKFLPSISRQQVVFANQADDSKKLPPADLDLDLANRLINQAILKREPVSSVDQVTPPSSFQPRGTARAKELLNQQATEQGTEAIPIVESPLEAKTESLPSSELAELSKEIQEVSKETKEQREQAEIAQKQQEINDLATTVTAPVAVSNKPVVVLPITTQSKEEAKFKSTKYSVRWLLEWCKKIAKMFSGAVIYKEEVDYE